MAPSDDASAPAALELVPFLAVTSVGYVLFAPAAIPAVLTTRFDVGYTAFGLLTSVPLLSVVVAQAMSGYLTARYSTTRILLGGTAMHVGVTLSLESAETFRTLLGLRAVWGLACGIVLTAGATHIATLHRGTDATYQQGVYGGALTFGGMIAFLAVPSLLEGVAPLGRYGPAVLLGALASTVCWRCRDERITAPNRNRRSSDRVATDDRETSDTETGSAGSVPKTSDDGPSDGRTRLTDAASSATRLLTHPVVVVAALCYSASLGSYVTLSTFITAYFDDLGVEGPLNVAVLFVATVGRAAGGVVADRWDVRDRASITAATVAAVAGFGILAVGRSPAILVFFPLVTMLTVSFPFGAIYGLTADASVDEGAAFAVVIAAGNVAALLLPTATGAIRDTTGGYSGAFLVLGAVNAIAAVGVVSLRKPPASRSSGR